MMIKIEAEDDEQAIRIAQAITEWAWHDMVMRTYPCIRRTSRFHREQHLRGKG